jgi:gamma-carbonic anhydrase
VFALNRIGARCNIRDGSIIHVDPGYPTIIGDNFFGHMTFIQGCTINDPGFSGIGAIVMNGATFNGDAILAAHSMLTERKR